ncbi:hypothetical protein [Sutcliffiella horikoshii]|uniref:hypothetical protein n=1 Tax=Sutcliffiella horikoshii TaxID=79883 RepID=UPI001F434761|nr:hypothetical protein [Sutcliffiella horikoshii]
MIALYKVVGVFAAGRDWVVGENPGGAGDEIQYILSTGYSLDEWASIQFAN